MKKQMAHLNKRKLNLSLTGSRERRRRHLTQMHLNYKERVVMGMLHNLQRLPSCP